LCAATLTTLTRTRWRYVSFAALALVTLVDGISAARVRPVGASGYEQAAAYVVERGDSPTTLYSASIDTGYFVFFVRKHDRDTRQIVLRSDKILTTSLMGDLSVESQIEGPEDIYPLLDAYGTRLVVIEDHDTGSPALDWLREELQGDRFVERRRFPVLTRDRRLADVDVVVYEYLDAKPADTNAEVDVNLPIIGRDIELRLGEILKED
jgi:hypothetical protein